MKEIGAKSPKDYGSKTFEFSDLDKRYLRDMDKAQLEVLSEPISEPIGRVTKGGCACKKEWKVTGYPAVDEYCLSVPDMGEVCLTRTKADGCPNGWGYCKPM